MPIDITKVTDIQELEAIGYRELKALQNAQNNIQYIEARIQELQVDEARKSAGAGDQKKPE